MEEIKPKYNVGQIIIYKNGDKYELGVVKNIIPITGPTISEGDSGWSTQDIVLKGFDYFVNYHTGENAARTPENHMHEISNAYAFDIRKLQVYEGYR